MELHLGDVLNKILKGNVTVTLEDRKGKDYGIPNHAEILDIINPADNDPWDVLILGYHKNLRSHAKYKVRYIKGIIWLPNENHKILVSIDEKGYSDEKYREDLEKYLKNYKKAHPKLRDSISYINYKNICSSFKQPKSNWKLIEELDVDKKFFVPEDEYEFPDDEPWYIIEKDSRGHLKQKRKFKPALTSNEDCDIHIFESQYFTRKILDTSTNPIIRDINNSTFLPSREIMGFDKGGLENDSQIYLCVQKKNGKYELVARCSIFPYPEYKLFGHDDVIVYYPKERKFREYKLDSTQHKLRDRILQIEDVRVEDKYKRKGFCLKFLRKAVRLAMEHFKGYKYLYINTDWDNYSARRCYQRLMEFPRIEPENYTGIDFFDNKGVYWLSKLSQLRL